MPGSPAVSPNFDIPRYSDGDNATFSSQVNSVTDGFDALAVRHDDPRLSDARNPIPGSVAGGAIPNAAIVGQQIAPATITQNNMAPASIGDPQIINGSLLTQDLADGAVTSPKIGAGQVQSVNIGASQVTIDKLGPLVSVAIGQSGDLVWSAAPTRVGCVLCDGSAYSRTDPNYAALYAAIGTTYGSGDGSTTFNVPDIRGRVMVATGTGPGLSARGLNGKWGEENHTLVLGEMPSHDHGTWTGGMNQNNPHAHSIYDPGHAHSISDPGHAHTYWAGDSANCILYGGSMEPGHAGAWGAAGTSAAGSSGSGTGIGIYGASTGIGIYNTDINHSHQIPAQGSNAGHNNLQPSIGLNCFIKL